MHSLMCDLVEEEGGTISTVVYCPHGPDEGCRCRKPAPGLLERIGEELQISVEGAWYVGDSEKDIELAVAMNCIPILVRSGKGMQTEAHMRKADALPRFVFDDLAAAADFIIESRAKNRGTAKDV